MNKLSARRNARQKRRRVQAQTGEILTEAASVERLQEKQKSRQEKADKGKGVKGKSLAKGAKGKKGKPGPVATSESESSRPPNPGLTEGESQPEVASHPKEALQ